jgi:hypothetical protein
MTSLENVEHELNGCVLIQVKTAANMRDERRIAANVAKLPGPLR